MNSKERCSQPMGEEPGRLRRSCALSSLLSTPTHTPGRLQSLVAHPPMEGVAALGGACVQGEDGNTSGHRALVLFLLTLLLNPAETLVVGWARRRCIHRAALNHSSLTSSFRPVSPSAEAKARAVALKAGKNADGSTPKPRGRPPASAAAAAAKAARKSSILARSDFAAVLARARAQLSRARRERTLLDAHAADGWRGAGKDRVRLSADADRARRALGQAQAALVAAVAECEAAHDDKALPASAYDSEGEVDEGAIFCGRCGRFDCADDDDIILCDGDACGRAYHAACLVPPLDVGTELADPEDGWLCRACEVKAEILMAVNDEFGYDYEQDTPSAALFARPPLPPSPPAGSDGDGGGGGVGALGTLALPPGVPKPTGGTLGLLFGDDLPEDDDEDDEEGDSDFRSGGNGRGGVGTASGTSGGSSSLSSSSDGDSGTSSPSPSSDAGSSSGDEEDGEREKGARSTRSRASASAAPSSSSDSETPPPSLSGLVGGDASDTTSSGGGGGGARRRPRAAAVAAQRAWQEDAVARAAATAAAPPAAAGPSPSSPRSPSRPSSGGGRRRRRGAGRVDYAALNAAMFGEDGGEAYAGEADDGDWGSQPLSSPGRSGGSKKAEKKRRRRAATQSSGSD